MLQNIFAGGDYMGAVLNLYMLMDELKHTFSFKGNIQSAPWELLLSHVRLADRGPNFSVSSAVYIVEAKNLPALVPAEMETYSLICIGLPPKQYLTRKCSLIYTEEELSTEILFNVVADIFYRYDVWKEKLQSIVEEEKSLEKMGQAALAFLENPILVQGPSFSIIFHVYSPAKEDSPEAYIRYLKSDTFSPDEKFSTDDILLLSQWDDFYRVKSMKHPEILDNPQASYHALVCPIRAKEQCMGYVCVDLVKRGLQQGDYGRIQILADYLGKALQKKYIHSITTQPDLEQVMNRLLSHTLVPERKILNVIRYYEWNMDDCFLCICLQPILRSSFTPNLASIASTISRSLSCDFVTVHDGNIVLLINLSKSLDDEYRIQTRLKTALRDNLMSAGISDPFRDFKNLYYYYDQARHALKSGRHNGGDAWIYHFSDTTLDYYLKKCHTKQITEAILPEGLKKLMQYDQKNGTSYTEVLKCYLRNDRSISQTVKECFIHRNTFLNWLDKIKSILQMNLDDHNVRLVLLMAFAIEEKYGPLNF